MVSKMAWEIRWTFIRALESAKLYFDELFFSKTYNVLAKKYYGELCHDTEGW